MDKEIHKLLTNIKSVQLLPIKVKFDISTLNAMMAFLYKDSVLRTRKTQSNIFKLINNLDYDYYKDQPALTERLWIIKYRLEDKIETNNEMLMTCLKDDLECSEYARDIIDTIPSLKISHEESKYLIKKIDDTLQYGYIVTIKDILFPMSF